MRLIECYIENFGKICKQKFEFSQGFNCICRDNGEGKTTLSVFIKAMLYGLSDSRKTDLSENERRHYLPWSGGECGGSLTFSVGGKIYRVERSFASKASGDSFALYDVSLGRASEDFSSDIGGELFGIDADGFERTVFLSERSLSPRSDNKSVSAKLSNLSDTDWDMGVMDEAVRTLDEKRKHLYKKGGGGRLSELRSMISEAEAELSTLEGIERRVREDESELALLSEALEAVIARQGELSAERGAALARLEGEKIEKRLSELSAELEKKKKRLSELKGFFGTRIPSSRDIETHSLGYSRGKSLIGETGTEVSEEYSALSARFADCTDDEVFAALAARDLLSREDAEQSHALFSRRVPRGDEIDSQIASVRLRTNPAILALILASIVGGVLAFSAPVPYRYVIFALAAATLVGAVLVGVIGIRMRQNAALKFIVEITDIPQRRGEELSTLMAMRALLNSASLSESKDRAAARLVLSEFIKKSCTKENDAKAIDKAFSDYEKYKQLRAGEMYRAEARRAREAEGRELISAASRFTESYGLSGDEAFTTLRSALNEYNALSEAVSRGESELSGFRALHKRSEINARPLSEIESEMATAEQRKSELTAKIGAKRAAVQSGYMQLYRREEITDKAESLREELCRSESELKIIQLTQGYLTAAKDSLTAKYLGKTKSAFEKYAALISGEQDAHLEMSTDFATSRIEGGKTHPTEAYSRGSRDLYALAARLALADSLYDGELPFIMLDDPFASLDDKKTASGIALLKKIAKDRQLIYFTCSSSRC